MALQIHPSLSSSLFKKPSHRLLLLPLRKPTKLKIKAKNPTSNPTPPNKKPTAVSPARGFGSQSSTAATSSKTSGSWSKKKRKRNRRGRASIVWKTPVGKPGFIRQEYEATFKEMSRNENAFILAWLGLGGIILVEDLVLAASGMLPEEWDKFVVKSLYPSFIPIVGLFVAGTVACGVLKNLQNKNVEDLKR